MRWDSQLERTLGSTVPLARWWYHTTINMGGLGRLQGLAGRVRCICQFPLQFKLGFLSIPNGVSLGKTVRHVSLSLAGPDWNPQHGSSAPTGMRILVTLLLDTLPMLGNVLLLCFFVFFIFGIVGVQLWAGLLRNRCFLPENFSL